MANEPTFNPNAYRDARGERAPQPRGPGPLRAGLDVQDRHGVGGARREGDGRRRVDRHQPGAAGDRGSLARHHRRRRPQQRRAVVHESDRQVEQHRRGEDRLQGRHRTTEPLRRTLRIRPPGRRPISRPRTPASSGARRSGPRARSRRCRWAIRSRVTPLQMVAAVSAVANGGEYVEPRVVRAVYRNGVRYQATPKVVRRADQRRHRGGADLDHGRGRHRRHGETRAHRRLHRRRQDRHGAETDRRPATRIPITTRRSSGSCRRATRRSRSSSSSTRRTARTAITAARVAAPIFKNIAEPALRYLGIPPTINPAPPVLVARGELAAPTPTAVDRRDGDPVISLIADGPPGTVPDLRGLSAREAVRKLVTLGLNAHVSRRRLRRVAVAGAGHAARRRRRSAVSCFSNRSRVRRRRTAQP